MVQKISVDITTAFGEGAGTEGEVFLGLGGREFRLDIVDHADFEEGDEVVYEFGEDSNVLHPERNDPRKGRPVSFEDLSLYPCYIRLVPRAGSDDWKLAGIKVNVVADGDRTAIFTALEGGAENIWLGRQSGAMLYLRRRD